MRAIAFGVYRRREKECPCISIFLLRKHYFLPSTFLNKIIKHRNMNLDPTWGEMLDFLWHETSHTLQFDHTKHILKGSRKSLQTKIWSRPWARSPQINFKSTAHFTLKIVYWAWDTVSCLKLEQCTLPAISLSFPGLRFARCNMQEAINPAR